MLKKIDFLLEKNFFSNKAQMLGTGGQVWATRQTRGDRSQIFEKFYDFRQFLVIFDFFSKMVDFWAELIMIRKVCRWKIVGV